MSAQRAESEIRRGLGLPAAAAGVYVQLQMQDQAQACLRKVLEINPDDALPRYQLGMLQHRAHTPRSRAG